jgi:hypothetical protein
MFIHKYVIGEDTFYRVTKGKSVGGDIVNVAKGDWKGYSTGAGAQNALSWLGKLTFSKDIEEPEEKSEEKKVACISSTIKEMADKLSVAKED